MERMREERTVKGIYWPPAGERLRRGHRKGWTEGAKEGLDLRRLIIYE